MPFAFAPQKWGGGSGARSVGTPRLWGVATERWVPGAGGVCAMHVHHLLLHLLLQLLLHLLLLL